MTTLDLIRASAGRPTPNPVLARLATQHERNADAAPRAVKEHRAVQADPPAQANQIGLAYVLLNKLRNHNPAVERTAREWMDANKATMTKRQISDVINRLRGHLARPAGVPTPATNTPPRNADVWAEWRALAAHLVEMGGRHGARFAVDTEPGAANRTAFWWIVPGRDGRYFLRQMIGGHAEAQRVRLGVDAMLAIGRKIDVDPKEAMLRYGRELGECGHCGRTLTNDHSRAAGIGPVCAKGKGW